jgi:Flp pilus assembly protein TadG
MSSLRKKRASKEAGSILVFVALAMTVLLGFVGLVIDVGQLYIAKQRAQAAADSAALAAAVNLYQGAGYEGIVTTSATNYFNLNAPANATLHTPISYYRACPFSWCNAGNMTLINNNYYKLAEVVVTVPVNATFLRVLGITRVNVSATADAAIVQGLGRVPIIVTSPTQSPALTVSGTLQICSGPTTALDVNSTSASSINNGGTIDLSHAGPLDSGNCSSGTGASLANAGQLTGSPPVLGSGTYTSGATAIADPLSVVVEPGTQPAAPASQNFPAGLNTYYNCPVACIVMFPGDYPSGIQVLSGFVVFAPGIYYLDAGGFQVGSGAIVRSATGGTDPNTGSGMLIFNAGPSAADIFSITAGLGDPQIVPTDLNCGSGGDCLKGSDATSSYDGILFFQARGTTLTLNHSVTVTATYPVQLSGSLYFNTLSGSNTLNWTGGTCSTGTATGTTGPIVGDVINIMSGCLQANLAQQVYIVPGVALVN